MWFSRQKVSRVKKRLEKDKTIWGYNAVFDDEKLDVKRYILLVKRSSKPIGDAINKITQLTAEKRGRKVGINVLSVGYLHGRYDVAIVFTAEDIKHAKKFSEILVAEGANLLSEVELMEFIFLLREGGITNPEIKKFKEFF